MPKIDIIPFEVDPIPKSKTSSKKTSSKKTSSKKTESATKTPEMEKLTSDKTKNEKSKCEKKEEKLIEERKPFGTKFKNVTYVDYKNINPNNVIFVDSGNIVHGVVRPYNVMYKYSSGIYSVRMNIFCDNIKLSQSRKGVITTKYSSFLLFGESEQYDVLKSELQKLKKQYIDYLSDNCGIKFERYYLDNIEKEEIKIYIGQGNNFPHVIKLGSIAENNINTEILNIEQYVALLKDYKYNKEDSESYYVASMIISIRCSVYDKLYDGKRLSFKPYVKMMEMKYNKAHCVPVMKPVENVVITDNVLVL